MIKDFKVYQVDNYLNNTTFDTDFFERFFFKNPPNSTKPLSGLSLRLGLVLLNELSFSKPQKLPQRITLSKKLHVSQQAIIENLTLLEQIGFIERTIVVNKINKRKFNDTFTLNYFYNMNIDDLKELNKRIIFIKINQSTEDNIKNNIKSLVNIKNI